MFRRATKWFLKIDAEDSQAIKKVIEKTDWGWYKSALTMQDARKSTGVSFNDYNKYNLYKYQKNELADEVKKIKENEKSQNKKIRPREIRHAIMEKTGWSEDVVKQRFAEAKERTGCSLSEYYKYNFFEKTQLQQEQLFLTCHNKEMYKKYKPDDQLVGIVCDKEKSNVFLEEYLHRAWCANYRIKEEEFFELFKNSEKLVFKPLDGHKGIGIRTFSINKDNREDVYREIVNEQDGVVEEFIAQHKDMNSITDKSVNTVRIVTLSDNLEQAKTGKTEIIYAAFRVGGGKSVVDNFSSGGMVAAIDINSGIVTTDAGDLKGNRYVVHPETGVAIKGFKIPCFQEAVTMVKDAIEKKGIYGYCGWDIAISEDGPVLVELNLLPGASLLSVPYSLDNGNSLEIMHKYFN